MHISVATIHKINLYRLLESMQSNLRQSYLKYNFKNKHF